MNHTQITSLADKAPVSSVSVQILKIDAPTQSPKQAQANLHSQFIHCIELEEQQPVRLRLIRGDMHFNNDMIGEKRIFSIGASGRNLNKIIAPSGEWYIQVDAGVSIQPLDEPAGKPVAAGVVTPTPVAQSAAPVEVAPIKAKITRIGAFAVTDGIEHPDGWGFDGSGGAVGVQVRSGKENLYGGYTMAELKEIAWVNAPAPTPAVVSTVEPVPEPEPEPEEECTGPELHPSLIKFARGQALCRMAAAKVFRECGFEVSPDQLGGVATSLFIQLSQKGMLDDVIALGFPAAKPKPAAAPKAAPAARPVADKPAAVVTPAPVAPKPAVTPPVPQPSVAPAPTPAPVVEKAPEPDVIKDDAPAKKPAKTATKEEVLAKYDKEMRAGEMKEARMSAFQARRTELGIPWDEISPYVIAYAVEKYGQAATTAYLDKFRSMKGVDEESMARGISSAPVLFLDKIEKTAKAAK